MKTRQTLLLLICSLSYTVCQNTTKCEETMKFLNCRNGTKKIYMNQNLRIVADLRKCEGREYTFNYELIERNGKVYEDHNNPSLILTKSPFTLDPGIYLVVLNVKADDLSTYIDDCNLEVAASPPFPVIDKGFHRYIGTGQDLILDGSRSMDFNSKNATDSSNFEFEWKYKCDTCAKFDTIADKKARVSIAGTRHKKNMTYVIKLGVRVKWWKDTVYATQVVYVRSNTPALQIRCYEGCTLPFLSDILIVSVECTDKCPKKPDYIWKIYKVQDNDDDIINGTAKWKFIRKQSSGDYESHLIREDDNTINLANTNYLVTASLQNHTEEASYKYNRGSVFQFKCELQPREGMIMETKFKFICNGSMDFTYAWVSVSGQDTKRKEILQYDSNPNYLSFTIPRYSHVTLNFMDYTGKKGLLFWKVNVDFKLRPAMKTTEEIQDIYYNSSDSVKNLLDMKDHTHLLDKMIITAHSIASFNDADYQKVEPIAEELIRDLGKLPLTDLVNLAKAASIMRDLTDMKRTFSPEFTAAATDMCRKIASKFEKQMHFINDNSELEQLEISLSELMRCSTLGNRGNESLIEMKDVVVNFTTPLYPIDDGENNTEVYDEYKDESEAVHNIELFKNATRDFVDVCVIAGETFVKQIQPKDIKYLGSGNYRLLVSKDIGHSIVHRLFFIQEVRFYISKDFSDSNKLYSIVACGTTDNPIWWEKDIEVCSDTVEIILRKSKNSQILSHFHRPFEINFKLKREPKVIHPPTIISAGEDHSTEISKPLSAERIIIFQTVLEAGHALIVEFLGLDRNRKMHVISTNFRLPRWTDFQTDYQKIKNSSGYYFSQNLKNYDVFHFVGVMSLHIQPSNVTKVDSEVQINAYDVFCVKVFQNQKTWYPDCKAKMKIKNRVNCFCKTLSTISVSKRNIPVKKWQSYTPLPTYLEEHKSYSFCIAVAVLFLLYSIVICFAVKEEDYILKPVYFLSDIQSDNRFAYLIIIKTSGRPGSGTTSNVMIKLKGEKGESEAHVLNYPDPLMLMLQRGNENWFLLATKNNLGTIEEMELWIDGIGARTSWYCRCADVYDLQHRTRYFFKIFEDFIVYPKPKIHLKFTPVDGKGTRTKRRVIIDILRKCSPSFRKFSWSLRQTEETLPFFRRITLMLSILLSVTIWIIIINGFPQRTPTDSIMKHCTYVISGRTFVSGFGGSITTAFYQIPIDYFFMFSKVQIPKHPFSQKSKGPVLFTLICWILTATIITTSLTVIMIYGIWIPHLQSMMLMTEVLIGFLLYIFVVDAIWNCAIKLTQSEIELTRYLRKTYRTLLHNIENQRRTLYNAYGKFLLRPFLQHLYTPVQGLALRVKWHIEKVKYDVRELIRNLFMFLIYLSLMYMVILANKDYRDVYSNRHVKKITTGEATRTFTLEQVDTPRQLEKYIKKTLIEATQSRTWYKNYSFNTPGMTKNFANKMIGIIRLRQHRSERNSCIVPEEIRFLKFPCHDDYFHSQVQKDFGEKWNDSIPPLTVGRMKNVWRYQPNNYDGSSTYIGKLGIYPGGGYTAYLGRGMKNSLINLKYLRENRWIDELTRSVFIEFLLYNVNSNVFNAVRYIIEKSNVGYLKKEVTVQTSKMLLLERETFIAFPVLLGLFSFFVAVFSVMTIARIKQTGTWYFKDLWHLVDIILIALSIGCVVMLSRRSREVGALLELLEGKDPKDFVDYFPLLQADETFTTICAILIAFATVKLWGLFRFVTIFRIVERTFKLSFLPLCALIVYNIITISAFALFGFVLFVDHSYKFAGYFNSFEFLIILNLRPFEGKELEMLDDPKYGLGYVFYVSYALSVILFACIFTALIIIYYLKAQHYYSNYSGDYSVKDYLKEQYYFRYNLFKARLRGGHVTNRTDPVTPKADEDRYAESMAISHDKIKAMSLVSLCAIRNSHSNRKPLTKKDVRLMTYTLYYLKKMNQPNGDEGSKERFYKGHLGGNKIKLVHENVLTKVEVATNILLGGTPPRSNVKNDDNLAKENIARVKRMMTNLSIMLDTVRRISVEITSLKEE